MMSQVSARFVSLLILALIAGALVSFPAGAETVTCSDPTISVEAESAEVSQRICETVMEAKKLLTGCYLRQTSDIRIVVMQTLPGAEFPCLATFSCDRKTIEIVDQKKMRSFPKEDDPYFSVPTEDLFNSLIAHELTHALNSSTGCGPGSRIVDQEYMAYAMQLESMPPATRQKLVDAFPLAGPVDPEELNEFVLHIAPVRFAVKAWRHFSETGNGCEVFRKIIAEETSFFSSPH